METFKRDLNKGIEIEEKILKVIHKKYPNAYRVEGNFKGYDILIPEIHKTVEVKCDEKSNETGNIVVEVEFNGKRSALMTTTADYWVWYDGNEFVWFTPKGILECVVETNPKLREFTAKGDTKSKKAYLIKKDVLWKYSLKNI